MPWRFVSFVLWQCAGALLGWGVSVYFSLARDFEGALIGVLIGAVIASLAWLAWDLARASRLLTWLRRGDAAAPVRLNGFWLDLQQRMRKALTERERREAASDARLQDFLAAMQASPNGVVLLDADTRIEWFNQTATLHFGFEPERDLLQHIGNLVREPAFASYLGLRDFTHGVTLLGKASTEQRPVKLAVQMHAYGEGRSLLLSRDVTQIEQADAMRRDFVANVSHEIRTPLTVVSGFVETLQSLPLEEPQRQRYLGLIAEQAQRMQTLVNDLLALSRLEGSPPVNLAEWTPVGHLMRQVVSEAKTLSASVAQTKEPQHQIEFLGMEACEHWELAGSPSELLSAFTNLVGNAVRYTPVPGLIQISWILLPDGRAEFAVKDTGPGIGAEHVPRLTERFYRVDRSRSRDTGGTGLGLAIVKHVAQRHGAQLLIKSEPGAGSTFALAFAAGRVRASDKVK
jgi:two-component system, OmpR family, phosphate regulon sensor histidine kinase PhoR